MDTDDKKQSIMPFLLFVALGLHPTDWGRLASAVAGVMLAWWMVSRLNNRWKYALWAILPVVCFLVMSHVSVFLNGWLAQNQPLQLVGDLLHYAKQTGSSAVPVVSGTGDFVTTGNIDFLESSGAKPHYMFVLAVIVIGIAVIAIRDKRNKSKNQAESS